MTGSIALSGSAAVETMVRFMTFSKLSLSASIRNDTRFKILLKIRPFNPGSVLLPFTRRQRRRTSAGLVGNLEVVCASRGFFAVSNFWSRRGRGLILKFLFVSLLLAVGFTPNVAWALVTCTYAASVNENSGTNTLDFAQSPSGLAADQCLNFGTIDLITTPRSSGKGDWTSTPNGPSFDNTIFYTRHTGVVGIDTFTVPDAADGAIVNVTITINAIAPVAGAKSATVTYATATPIGLSSVITGGSATSVTVANAPGHGSTSISGTTITYTATTGYYGPDSFTYTAANGPRTSAPPTVSITVSAPTIVVSPPTLTPGTFGSAYSQSLTASGGQAPYTYARASGGLPGGLSLASTGAITGTPTAAGNFTFTVTGTDSSTATHASFSSGTIALNINGAPTATQAIASTSLTVNHPATSFTPVTGSGGTGSLSYSVSPSLPTGLSMAAGTGAITGTPSVASSATAYTVTVKDANNSTATATFSLTVNGAVTATQAIASTILTVNVAATSFTPVTGSGGTSPLTYSCSPALPSGLSMASGTGAITGMPAAASSATSYTVTVTDANNATATATFSLTVAAPTLAVAVSGSPASVVAGNNITYSISLTVGTGTATNVSLSDPLPAGLGFVSYSVTGPVWTCMTPAVGSGGTVTCSIASAAPGTYNFTIVAQVAAGTPPGSTTNTATASASNATAQSASATNTISLPTLSVAASGSPASVVAGGNITYSISLVVGGGTANNVSLSDPLPAGLGFVSYSVTGPVWTCATPAVGSGGTVTCSIASAAPGTYNFTIVAQVAAGTPPGSITNTATASASNATAVSGSATNSVILQTTSVAVASSLNPSLVGQSVTFTATVSVSSGTPTGTVTFKDGTATLGTGPVSGGQATFATGALTGGPHAITAIYGGDGNFSGNTSPALTQAVNAISATTASLASSVNPSAPGQTVIFTATVTSAGGTPTGVVTFGDGGAVIGSSPLAGGVATFVTASLAAGAHSITANYGGATGFAASTSSVLTQTVAIPADSIKLRQLQVAVTRVVAQNSGQAISGAFDNAIADGFRDGGGLVTPGGSGLRLNFSPAPDQPDASSATGSEKVVSDRWTGMFGRDGTSANDARGYARNRQNTSRVDDAFAAIHRNTMATKAPPLIGREPKEWLLWADVRGSGIDRWGSTMGTGSALLYGTQVNALMGLTRKLTPNFLIGVAGGYETFDYTSQDLNGKLKGNGLTVGSYLGWRLSPAIRFDAAVAYSGIGYDGTAATAQGNFDGHRWMVSSGLTGNTKAYGFDIEPSAKIYALWEHENAYTDSLGTHQADRDFATGRASAGVKLAYPFAWSDTVALAPYVGLYGDYYFTHDDAAAIAAAGALPPASTPLLG